MSQRLLRTAIKGDQPMAVKVNTWQARCEHLARTMGMTAAALGQSLDKAIAEERERQIAERSASGKGAGTGQKKTTTPRTTKSKVLQGAGT